MTRQFFDRPILNSPYEYPDRHWEFDEGRQPTDRILDVRRRSDLITPVPKPKTRRRKSGQTDGARFRRWSFDREAGIQPDSHHQRNPHLRRGLAQAPEPERLAGDPRDSRLLQHWRHHPFHSVRPFFCQVEAVETIVWLTEVAPKLGKRAEKFRAHIEGANEQANPELLRLALKLATGAGKTTVIAMLIAWQTVNAVRHRNSKTFSRGFLIITPGITIRDRLRVLMPNDPDSYYEGRELVPGDMLSDIDRAKIVLTNYHAFKLRERIDLAKGTRHCSRAVGRS
jgi:type III restriction enzyme